MALMDSGIHTGGICISYLLPQNRISVVLLRLHFTTHLCLMEQFPMVVIYARMWVDAALNREPP